ncbi:tRNA pseudouridine(38/39) synthase isoform X1 [Cucumis melo var. makuwa]|uniref:tRNA pseudouridine(38/39) synthase isoform X1 n=1 Tax=Cucumis melo var. makuwa TaxID=1194695 RepID=A0A5D3C242_CUCMM|nr:tRNA pseudouridine(38/39) synthase isoform X1 [Cucumis melo var. makuwa]
MDGAELFTDITETTGAIRKTLEANEFQPFDGNQIASLQSQLRLLQDRVKELEEENSKLSSPLASCCCSERRMNFGDRSCSIEKSTESGTTKKKSVERTTGYNTRILDHCSKRYIALKVMYFGQRFYGFASEAQMEPTVESEIFRALEKARLLVGGRKESCYSRCGRTDKGVSSVGQVIALYLRSNLKDPPNAENSCHNAEEQHDGEIDYVRVINKVLPNDIRVLGWCPVPVGFSARNNLDLHFHQAMERAGKKFVGEHDFRNFCKMDAANVHNYRRCIMSFDISPCDVRLVFVSDLLVFFPIGLPVPCLIDTCLAFAHFYSRICFAYVLQAIQTSFPLAIVKLMLLYSPIFGLSSLLAMFSPRTEGNLLWAFNIEGSAFLWHQVRCMVAVVFMVGQGLEDPDVVDILLDPLRTPRKPQYVMASENPLVLHSCEFEGVKFRCSSDAGEALQLHLSNEIRTYKLQAAIFKEALLSCLPNDGSSSDNRKLKKKNSHVALLSRPTEQVINISLRHSVTAGCNSRV